MAMAAVLRVIRRMVRSVRPKLAAKRRSNCRSPRPVARLRVETGSNNAATGSNGPFSARQFDELMAELADVRRVVFVTVKVPRRWEAPNNNVIAEGVRRYPNAVLADWHTASADHPELFRPDGIHLRPAGASIYADVLAAAVNAP